MISIEKTQTALLCMAVAGDADLAVLLIPSLGMTQLSLGTWTGNCRKGILGMLEQICGLVAWKGATLGSYSSKNINNLFLVRVLHGSYYFCVQFWIFFFMVLNSMGMLYKSSFTNLMWNDNHIRLVKLQVLIIK